MKKKLFISCPMKGRTEEAIKNSMEKLHTIAELVFGEELDVINSYIDRVPETKNQAVSYLAESIGKMADADYVIGVNTYSAYYKGCQVEKDVAYRYGIPCYFIDIAYCNFMRDAVNLIREYEEHGDAVCSGALSPR